MTSNYLKFFLAALLTASPILGWAQKGKGTCFVTHFKSQVLKVHDPELRAQVAEARARESARYDIALERIEESYPQLNPDADEYDAEMLQDVADLKSVYQTRGMTPTKALQAAVKKLLGVEDRDQKQATEVAPRVTEKDIAAERKKAAVSKTADAVRRTPPSTKDVGMDSDKAGGGLSPKDVMGMKKEDFAKLTDEQLAKLRGDNL